MFNFVSLRSSGGFFLLMKIVPYTYRRVDTSDPLYSSSSWSYLNNIDLIYEVILFCVFDGFKIHSFFHRFDQLEYAALVEESGCSYGLFCKRFLVYPGRFDDIFNKIVEFENVSFPDSHS